MAGKPPADKPVRLLSYADIARWFDVDPTTVRSWRIGRSPTLADHPFPVPDYEIGKDRPTPGWLPTREQEIRRWHADRPGQGAGGGRPWPA